MAMEVTEVKGMSGILGSVDDAAFRKLLDIANRWFEDPKHLEEYEEWKDEQE